MAGYLVVHYVALAFARADLLPPLIAAWTANVIFMGIGVSLLLRAVGDAHLGDAGGHRRDARAADLPHVK